jgi:hypothetical protein
MLLYNCRKILQNLESYKPDLSCAFASRRLEKLTRFFGVS